MNLQPEDCCHVNHDNQGIAYNTRSKRRAVEYDPTMPNQASTSTATPHATFSGAQQPTTANTSNNQNIRGSNEPQNVPIQSSVPVMTKALVKNANFPLNIVDQMKRTSLSVPMWDILSIPSQKDLLQKELESVVVQSQPTTTHVATSFV